VITAVVVNPGAFLSCRIASCRSVMRYFSLR
jgi:hypothetical protein